MAQVFLFGDSITYGMWDTQGGWATRLKVFLENKCIATGQENLEHYIAVWTLGIPGETSSGLIKRLDQEVSARLNSEQENIFLFAIGINDTHMQNHREGSEVPLSEYEANLRQMILSARKYSKKIIFVGITRVDEKLTNPLFWNQDVSYINKEVEKYDMCLETFCGENSLHYISLRNIDFTDLLQDGIHPNEKGHEKMYETIKDFLLKNKVL